MGGWGELHKASFSVEKKSNLSSKYSSVSVSSIGDAWSALNLGVPPILPRGAETFMKITP